MDNDIAVAVNNIKKDFILPHERSNSLKGKIVGVFKKKDNQKDIQHALKGLSFNIKKGEFFGIVGRNGCGKSTLLKIIAQIYQPTQGNIIVNGSLVPFIELGVGFNPELTGRENVFLNGALFGFSTKEMEERYDDIVKFAELEPFMEQKLKNYSSGMQVRLAFAVATRADADILLVDEVLAVGDADFQRKCYDYFKKLKKLKKTVIFVTHSMEAVREYCDKAVLIEDGNVQAEGSANKVADEYLKLFSQDNAEEIVENTKSELRLGNGQLKITNVKIKEEGQHLILDVDIKAFKESISNYVADYKFIDAEENIVMGGSSTDSLNNEKLSIKANNKQHLRFTIENILGGGTYSVGLVVRAFDKNVVYNTWDKVAFIELTKKGAQFPVSAPSSLEVKDV